jgi:ABC-type uncharacterized transport system YnjBCD permease subunit
METATPSKAARITGWVMTILPSLLFAFSGIMKLVASSSPQLAEGFTHLQIPVSWAVNLGILELACLVVYLVPRTAVIGAILLTGYLGGAMLTHLRVGEPPVTHVILGVVLWGGLFLRDPRLRALIPVVR